jgi:hypothetical protein
MLQYWHISSVSKVPLHLREVSIPEAEGIVKFSSKYEIELISNG